MKLSTLKTLLLTAFVLSAAVCHLCAVNDNAGTTGFQSLKTVHSARAIALGQALTGQAANPDGIHFNPASILGIEGYEIGSTYTNSFLDTQGGQLQFLMPKHKFTAWGFSLKYMNMGEFDHTLIDQNGDLIDTGETFGAYNLIATASLAKYISDAIDVGGTVKAIYDQIEDSSAAAAVIDLGAVHHPANEKVEVGVSVRNLGAQFLFYSDSQHKENLPLTFAAGISYQFNPKLFGGLDISKAEGEDVIARIGVEYEIYPSLDLRAGFRSNAGEGYNGGSLAFLSGFSLGAGWNWRNYRIDYGVASYGDLGLLNQLSLIYEF